MTTDNQEIPQGDGLPDTDAYSEFRHDKLVEALSVLREHFDAVIILAETIEQVVDEDGVTVDASRWWRRHFGSTYACQELCRQYRLEMRGGYERRGAMVFEECEDEEED